MGKRCFLTGSMVLKIFKAQFLTPLTPSPFRLHVGFQSQIGIFQFSKNVKLILRKSTKGKQKD